MKKAIPIAALLIVAIFTTAVTVGCSTQKAPPLTPDHSITAQDNEQITFEPEITSEPLYDSTHENGYCEGICPYFTGYPEPPFTDDDSTMLAKMVWGEARGCTPEEQRLVVWTVLQRVDADKWANTIQGVITQKSQFVGYNENYPLDTEIYNLCHEELMDWWHGAEPPTHEIYAPTAPYYFFDGDGSHNWFREE